MRSPMGCETGMFLVQQNAASGSPAVWHRRLKSGQGRWTWTWGVYEAVHKNGAAQGHAEWEERASRREESRAYGQHVAA